jgi:hypothetical protein
MAANRRSQHVPCYSAVTADEQLLPTGEHLQTPRSSGGTELRLSLLSSTERSLKLTEEVAQCRL